ncbi:hypothetical protein [Micromonospora zhanjiangensis]|uniref:Colicin import membrane protein n=1 Tax=Micromonospora zhanjiangensis TaxID=1522057 RepID=A0ABV8KST8_9ACTN
MDATAVWALLVIGGLVVLGLLGLAALAVRPTERGPAPAQLRAEAEELAAHATAAQVDAGRAAAVAVEARAAVASAEQLRDEAWAAQETAERAYEEAWRAAAEGRAATGGVPIPRPTDPGPAERAAGPDSAGPDSAERERAGQENAGPDSAEREREVSRAALSAYRRGDISVQQLREVWRRTADWDPVQEERERLAERCRIERAAARRVHDRAAAAARRAEQAARVAEVAAQALVDEAAQAAVEAHEALLAATPPTTRRSRSARRKPGV